VKDGFLEVAGPLLYGVSWLARDNDVVLSIEDSHDYFSRRRGPARRSLNLETHDRSFLEEEAGFLPSQPTFCLPLVRVGRYAYKRPTFREGEAREVVEVIEAVDRQEADYAMVLISKGQGATSIFRRVGMALQQTPKGPAEEVSYRWEQHSNFVGIGLTEETIFIV
jgi:hypothetical protein